MNKKHGVSISKFLPRGSVAEIKFLTTLIVAAWPQKQNIEIIRGYIRGAYIRGYIRGCGLAAMIKVRRSFICGCSHAATIKVGQSFICGHMATWPRGHEVKTLK